MLRIAGLAAAAALAAAPAAAADGVYGQVLSPQGRVLATAQGTTFDYPADGTLVHVGSATVDAGGATLTDVSLLGGLVQLNELDIVPGKTAVAGPIAAAGRLVTAKPDTLVPLGPLGYVMVDQRARSRGHLGRVALRLVLQQTAFGQPAGTQVLLGLPPARSGAEVVSRHAPYDPLAALGFSGAEAALLGFVPAPTDVSHSIGAQAVSIAERFLGVPYVWGGASPVPGFDCSGLALYVYAQLGIQLTHYTGAQFDEGLRLPREELQPGDLVFFDNDPLREPQHEGIYIGDDDFIQAPHSGDVVRISSLDDPRYGFSFVGGVRPYIA
jgi:cell wall-associated NlpC family hydrolase